MRTLRSRDEHLNRSADRCRYAGVQWRDAEPPSRRPAHAPACESGGRRGSRGGRRVRRRRTKAVAAEFPTYSAAWARLAEGRWPAGDPVTAYAYARTGYHRGLDQLRRNGWKGHGPVPWSHEPNQGFLRSLNALGTGR